MYSKELQHHGIKGQKWGVRRFQNDDGTLTPAGRSRYMSPDGRVTRAGRKEGKRIKKAIKRNWGDAFNSAQEEMAPLAKNISDKYSKTLNTDIDGWQYTEKGRKFISEYSATWRNLYSKKLSDIVNTDFTEMGEYFVQNAPLMDLYEQAFRPRSR